MGYITRLIKNRKLAATTDENTKPKQSGTTGPEMTDSAAALIEEQCLDPDSIPGTGAGGRITKKDVVSYIGQQKQNTEEEE